MLHISRRRYWLSASEEGFCCKQFLQVQTLRWYKVSARCGGDGDRWFVIVSTVRGALWFRSNVFTQAAHVWYIKPTDANGNCTSRPRQVIQIASVNCREIRQGGSTRITRENLQNVWPEICQSHSFCSRTTNISDSGIPKLLIHVHLLL
jgi:hypothetical protein